MPGDEKPTNHPDSYETHTPTAVSTPMRAVLDTNILVAYALMAGKAVHHDARRHDALRRCVERVRQDRGMLGSADTMQELHTTLMRPDFERYQRAAERRSFCSTIMAETTMVAQPPEVRLCRDPNDDMFLAVALAGNADWLVTVDQQLLSVKRIGRTVILRPERLMERLG